METIIFNADSISTAAGTLKEYAEGYGEANTTFKSYVTALERVWTDGNDIKTLTGNLESAYTSLNAKKESLLANCDNLNSIVTKYTTTDGSASF